MFLALWHYLHGYVMIKVMGFSVERFVNMAVYRGIYLWDMHPTKTAMTMNVSKVGFRMLEECAEKTGCRYEVIEEFGLPVRLKKYEKRKILAFGILFFAIALYVLSSFIWEVELIGNERLKKEDILLFCKEIGLKPGAFKLKVDTEEITKTLIEEFPDISWVSVKIQGTNVSIKLVETILQPEILDKEKISDIVSLKDCVITSIATEAGTPKVSVGDVVKTGDVLISSLIPLKDGEEEVGVSYVPARGIVRAKLWLNINDSLPLSYIEKVPTGVLKKDNSIVINDVVLNILTPKLSDGLYQINSSEEKKLGIGDFTLPISLVKGYYEQYTEVEKTRTINAAKIDLKKNIEEKATSLLGKEGEILEIQIDFLQEGDTINAGAVVTVSERIDKTVEVKQEEEALHDTNRKDVAN